MENCIEFQGARDCNGYGRKWYKGQMRLAHRVALASREGIDMPDASVLCLHSCNNPPCVNPEHLRWGTVTDNMQDAVRAGRARQNYMANAKITSEQAEEIRSLYATGNYTQKELGDRFNISRGRISHIVTNVGWNGASQKWSK